MSFSVESILKQTLIVFEYFLLDLNHDKKLACFGCQDNCNK